MSYCKKCGKEIGENDKICSECGEDQGEFKVVDVYYENLTYIMKTEKKTRKY